MKIKTIDINALEWFDRVNGNSYFAAIVTLNYGTKTAKKIKLPFQYGYGSQNIQESMGELIAQGFIKDAQKYSSGGNESLSSYCERKKIILRTVKHENCKKSELKNI